MVMNLYSTFSKAPTAVACESRRNFRLEFPPLAGYYGSRYQSIHDLTPPTQPMSTSEQARPDYDTRDYVPYSFLTVMWGFERPLLI